MIAVLAASPVTLPVAVSAPPDVADHAFAGRAIVPAVWLLERLVETVAQHEGWPQPLLLPLAMADVAFPHFLSAEDFPRRGFTVALAPVSHGLCASLLSSLTLPSGMKRTREHARVTFIPAAHVPAAPATLATDYEVSAERVYRELIPFGPRYRNLLGTLRLGRDGGTALVRSPAPPLAAPPLGGCPYLLDGALHLACVWGQRYAGTVAYPTGFAARVLARSTPWGERRCTVVPRAVEPRRLLCDVWLCDEGGAACDTIVGLAMSPLAAGSPPPDWIAEGGERA